MIELSAYRLPTQPPDRMIQDSIHAFELEDILVNMLRESLNAGQWTPLEIDGHHRRTSDLLERRLILQTETGFLMTEQAKELLLEHYPVKHSNLASRPSTPNAPLHNMTLEPQRSPTTDHEIHDNHLSLEPNDTARTIARNPS